jgi:hypothetical protein
MVAVMEVEKLISALEEALSHLRNSKSSSWAQMPVEEIIEKLESEITKARISQRVDARLLGLLFAPTGAIQEISIENIWTNEFLRISEVVDQFTVDA